MNREGLRAQWEILESETLKTAAELALHGLSKHNWGEAVLAAVRGERIEDRRLNTEIAGIFMESPLLAGAGWDKKGWAVDGLYALGFAGTEVGSVLLFPQHGNPKPRLFTDSTHSVGLNRMGFNAIGVEGVAANLEAQKRPGVVGISIGKNKLLGDEYAPWAHAQVAEKLHYLTDYFVINVSSPNTPGLRDNLRPEPLTAIVRAVQEVLLKLGHKPLFIKTTVDLGLDDFDKVIQVALDENVDGIIDTNTTIDNNLKALYGWSGEMGGLSGNDPVFRARATDRMKYLTSQTRGTNLARIGVGGINDPATAIERIESGAQAIQVVTGIRQRGPRIAASINKGLLNYLELNNAKSIEDIVGIAV